LRGFGLSEPEAQATLKRLYNELVIFTRKAKLLELEAQLNRRGRSSEGPAASQLADDLRADLTASNQASVRRLPQDFVPPEVATMSLTLPVGRVAVEEATLFTNEQKYALRFGPVSLVKFESVHHRDLAFLLAVNRVRGNITIPRSGAHCRTMAIAIRDYLNNLTPKLQAGAAEITENADLQSRIVNEAMKRLLRPMA